MTEPLKDLLLSDHYTSLTKELLCSCGGYLEPPILLCVKGHSVCKKCHKKNNKCIICNESFTETRCIILEALVEKIHFPCTNQGCDFRTNANCIEKHIEVCQFRTTDCLMAKIYGECKWIGRASDWLEHCVENHQNRVTDLPFITFVDHWSPKHRDPIMKYHLMRCFNRVFNVYQIYDSKSGKMMWTVIATGDSLQSFYFDVKIFNPDNPFRKITFRQMCKTENDADVLDASQNVLISLEQVLYMLDNKKDIHTDILIRDASNKDSNECLLKIN